MPFFQVDDHLHANRKTRALAGRMLAGDPSGFAALGVWSMAGSMSQDVGTDGVVSLQMLISIGYDAAAMTQLAHQLVDAGLWHAPGHECARCEPVPAVDPTSGLPMACWRFHDWWEMKYDRAAAVREARAKRKELQDPAVVNTVWLRDCVDPADSALRNQGACRYCGRMVKRYDRSSKDEAARPTIDHVDPTKAAGVRNLALACFGCNRSKGKRTPADAGMALRPAPRTLTPAQEAAAGDAVAQAAPAAALTPPAPSTAPVSGPAVARGEAGPPEHSFEHSSSNPPQVSTDARAGTRAGTPPGQGQGQGQYLGQETGSAAGSPAGPTTGRSRRRRRGRGGKPNPTGTRPAPADLLDAGHAPLTPGPARDGSPWHQYRGPRNPLGDENHCPTHGHPEPCRTCQHEYDTEGAHA